MSADYAWPYLKATQSTTVHMKFVLPVSCLLSSVEAQTRIKLPRMFKLQLCKA